MSSLTFANLLIDHGIDNCLVQHLSMFLSAEQRVEFLDYLGINHEE